MPWNALFCYTEVMAIPNVKRFRPFCPTCNESFTVMAVLPKATDVSKYLEDTVARHDHKAFQEPNSCTSRSASASRTEESQVSPHRFRRLGSLHYIRPDAACGGDGRLRYGRVLVVNQFFQPRNGFGIAAAPSARARPIFSSWSTLDHSIKRGAHPRIPRSSTSKGSAEPL